MSGLNPNLRNFDPLSSSSRSYQNTNKTQSSIPSPPTRVPSTSSIPTMISEQLQYLKSQGFSTGMIRAFQFRKEIIPLRVWIIDNSSAMNVRDAHIIRINHQKIDNVSRWDELKDCLLFHADLTTRFNLPTRFAMLNAPQQPGLPQYFSLAQSGNLTQEHQIVQNVLAHAVPNGPSPIAAQLQILSEYISSIAGQLRARQHTVPIVVTTQGLPTNTQGVTSPDVINEFFRILKLYESLPVSIVLRLCTDDEKAIDFYNSVDKRLALPIDVLDDFYGEALEIYLRNPWLTYGLPLHRYREMGLRMSVLDVLDERSLSILELRELCNFLFDTAVPDPFVDWNAFVNAVAGCVSKEQMQWNPIKKCPSPWIDITLLNEIYKPVQYNPMNEGASFLYNGGPNFRPVPTSSSPRPPVAKSCHYPTSSNSVSSPAAGPLQSTSTSLVLAVESNWAKIPPTFTTKKSLVDLLSSVDETFELVPKHEYFTDKFQPFSKPALSTGSSDVLKRAVRKMRFFLHPDRLPRDFNEEQALLCRTIWDVISESWDSLDNSQEQK